jgi:hypothetical protein
LIRRMIDKNSRQLSNIKNKDHFSLIISFFGAVHFNSLKNVLRYFFPSII